MVRCSRVVQCFAVFGFLLGSPLSQAGSWRSAGWELRSLASKCAGLLARSSIDSQVKAALAKETLLTSEFNDLYPGQLEILANRFVKSHRQVLVKQWLDDPNFRIYQATARTHSNVAPWYVKKSELNQFLVFVDARKVPLGVFDMRSEGAFLAGTDFGWRLVDYYNGLGGWKFGDGFDLYLSNGSRLTLKRGKAEFELIPAPLIASQATVTMVTGDLMFLVEVEHRGEQIGLVVKPDKIKGYHGEYFTELGIAVGTQLIVTWDPESLLVSEAIL